MVRALLLVGCLVGCGASVTTVVSLQDIDCVSCGATIVDELQQTKGVSAARFDRTSVELAIDHDPERITAAALLTQVEAWGWPAVLGAGQGRYMAALTFPSGADVDWLTRDGSRVDLSAAPVAGKVTVVDFGAKWCRPCRAADVFLAERLGADAKLAVRKVEVVDWDSEVAQQHLGNVKELPYFVVFDASGRERARLGGFERERLAAALEAAQ